MSASVHALGVWGIYSPCRQRFNTLNRIISRELHHEHHEWHLRALQAVLGFLLASTRTARPRLPRPHCPQVKSMIANLIAFKCKEVALIDALRFLIISEVSLTGDIVNFNQKYPNSLMAIGFKG